MTTKKTLLEDKATAMMTVNRGQVIRLGGLRGMIFVPHTLSISMIFIQPWSMGLSH